MTRKMVVLLRMIWRQVELYCHLKRMFPLRELVELSGDLMANLFVSFPQRANQLQYSVWMRYEVPRRRKTFHDNSKCLVDFKKNHSPPRIRTKIRMMKMMRAQ